MCSEDASVLEQDLADCVGKLALKLVAAQSQLKTMKLKTKDSEDSLRLQSDLDEVFKLEYYLSVHFMSANLAYCGRVKLSARHWRRD